MRDLAWLIENDYKDLLYYYNILVILMESVVIQIWPCLRTDDSICRGFSHPASSEIPPIGGSVDLKFFFG